MLKNMIKQVNFQIFSDSRVSQHKYKSTLNIGVLVIT